jgi:hypothetical protein
LTKTSLVPSQGYPNLKGLNLSLIILWSPLIGPRACPLSLIPAPLGVILSAREGRAPPASAASRYLLRRAATPYDVLPPPCRAALHRVAFAAPLHSCICRSGLRRSCTRCRGELGRSVPVNQSKRAAAGLPTTAARTRRRRRGSS